MHIEPFVDQYDDLAALTGITVAELRARDERAFLPQRRFLARDGNRARAAVTARRRSDRRWFLTFEGPEAEAFGPLATASALQLPGRVCVSLDAGQIDLQEQLAQAGFGTELVVHRFLVPFAPALQRLHGAAPPPGFAFVTADRADERRLFTLDTTLRQDVPGCDGWRGDLDQFRDELADAPPFHPSGYQVAVDQSNGEYAGLVRMWRNPTGPRLGLLALVRQYRRTSLAAALLHAALTAASRWGYDAFTTEASPSNRRVYPALQRAGAELIGSGLQLALM